MLSGFLPSIITSNSRTTWGIFFQDKIRWDFINPSAETFTCYKSWRVIKRWNKRVIMLISYRKTQWRGRSLKEFNMMSKRTKWRGYDTPYLKRSDSTEFCSGRYWTPRLRSRKWSAVQRRGRKSCWCRGLLCICFHGTTPTAAPVFSVRRTWRTSWFCRWLVGFEQILLDCRSFSLFCLSHATLTDRLETLNKNFLFEYPEIINQTYTGCI